MSGEAASRADLGLPGRQRALAEAVLDLGKPVVVTLSSGRPLALPWLFERADAVLATWFLGVEAGHAIADVLTGKFNPTGRLPVSWPRQCRAGPDILQRASFRPPLRARRALFQHLSRSAADAAISFGHGLSYSRFALSDLRCEPSRVMASEDSDRGVACGSQPKLRSLVKRRVSVRARPRGEHRPAPLELKGVQKAVLAGGERTM